MTETTEILKERGQRYGRFDGHAKVTQRLKGVIAGELHIRRKELANDQQEALDMICHKIGRIINGDADYEDSWRDIAGYAQLVADRLLEPGNVTPVCGDTAVESVKQAKGETLKYSAPEPALPAGWIRPSKVYPQVAEDFFTRWQYAWVDGRWNRMIKPLHEMSPAELEDLDRGDIWELYKP